MKSKSHELQTIEVKKEGSGLSQLPDDMDYENLLIKAQNSGQIMCVAKPERTLTTETNEKEPFGIYTVC